MYACILFFALSLSAQEVPVLKETESDRAVSKVNENFRSVNSKLRNVQSDTKADILDDNNTWTGLNTFNRPLTFNDTVTVRSTLNISGIYGELHLISSVTVANVTFTNTGFSVCVATAVIRCDRNLAEIWYVGPLENATAGSITFLNVLKDGAFVSPLTDAIGIISASTANTSTPINGHFRYLFRVTANTSTSFCLAPRVDGSTGRIRNDANHSPVFGATCM